MTKKSFLEKLGIIERVDVEENEVVDKSQFFDEESGFEENEIEALLDDTFDVNEVEESPVQETVPSMPDLFSVNIEKLKAVESFEVEPEIKSEIEPEMVAPIKVSYEPEELISSPAQTSAEIEDKLNILIGAYEKNKMVSIEDIYRSARLAGDVKKSIFIADVFQKTLPENLPLDIKRESVLNILKVSNINSDELLSDAYQRIDALNTVLESTVATTEDILSKHDNSIKELEKRIEELKAVSDERRRFNDSQNTIIEYEIQKVINIVEFIKPKK